MPCECSTYECIEVKFNPCSEGAQLPLIADASGTWTMEIEFNGMWREAKFGVVADQAVVIPVEFLNEYYTHKVLFYSGGELINDTCYKIKSRSMTSAGTFAPISPDQLAEILAELALHSEQIADLDDEVTEIQAEIVSINEAVAAIQADLGRVLRVFEFTVPNEPTTDPFTMTSALFAGKTVWMIGFYSTSAYQRNQAFTQSGNTITMTQGDSFNIGDVLSIYYD